MKRYSDCPQVLREFLIYHENIMGQSQLTINEYYLDLRMFLRFVKLMRNDMPVSAKLETIDIRDVDIDFIREIDTSDIFDFLSYLANDRAINPESAAPDYGISASSRARKLSKLPFSSMLPALNRKPLRTWRKCRRAKSFFSPT